jgi:hypothetical protein
VDGGKEGRAVFGVSCCNAAPSFEVQERVFDQVAQFVKVFVIWPLIDAIFLRGNHGVHALRGGLFNDRVGIIALVRDKLICINALDQP